MNTSKIAASKINAAFKSVGLFERASRNANVFNEIRAGNSAGAIGTLMAGSSQADIAAKRAAFNRALNG